jgi:hypothetical protein
MARTSQLPDRFPIGSRYVLEAQGAFVIRYVEFPDGRRVDLTARPALPCNCADVKAITIVPALQKSVKVRARAC